MTKYLFYFFILSSMYAHSQDSLRYTNGNVRGVDSIKVNASTKIVEFFSNQQKQLVALRSLEAYYSNGEWTLISNEEKEESILPYRLSKTSYTQLRSNFSIGTNLTAFIFGSLKNEGNLLTQSNRALLTIEPEYRIVNKRVAIRMPLGIGLPQGGVLEAVETRKDNYYPQNALGYYNQYGIGMEHNFSPFYSRYMGGFTMYQAGVVLRYFIDKKRERFFISSGLHIGKADFGSITIYDSFTSTLTDPNLTSIYTESVMSVERDPFTFITPEIGLGYSAQLNKFFTLDVDASLTSRYNNKGNTPDRVNYRLDNSAYKVIYENLYRHPYYNPTRFVLRVRLFYHFQTKKQ